jgi:hypothetical protein
MHEGGRALTAILVEPVVAPVETPATQLIEDLRQVRRIIERGWCQGDYARGGNHCLMGAVYSATNTEVRGSEAFLLHKGQRDERINAAVDALGDELSEGDWIVNWNDWFGRTQDDVLRLVDQAIAHNT